MVWMAEVPQKPRAPMGHLAEVPQKPRAPIAWMAEVPQKPREPMHWMAEVPQNSRDPMASRTEVSQKPGILWLGWLKIAAKSTPGGPEAKIFTFELFFLFKMM